VSARAKPTKPHRTSRGKIRGPHAQAEAARLLAEGLTVTEVARRLGLARETVSVWKNHSAIDIVAVAVEKRAESYADAVALARSKLRDAAARAADVLVAQLDDADPAVASMAARTLLDRVGVPRSEVLVQAAAGPDLSKLSADELADLERLLEKAGASA